jgi:hypothetical protein
VVDLYIVYDIAVASGKWFCAGLVFLDVSLGVGSCVVSTLSTDGLFFACGFLRGNLGDARRHDSGCSV